MADYTGLGNNVLGGLGLQDSENSLGFYWEIPAVDVTAPTVSNVTPASGSELAADDSVTFDVTDDSGAFYSVSVFVRFAADETWEVVYYSGGFTPRYQRDSSKATISGGYRFVIKRWGDWPSAPEIIVEPFDGGGNTSS